MGNRKDKDFFGTADGYNSNEPAQNSDELLDSDYNKYLNDYDDGEDIILKSSINEDDFVEFIDPDAETVPVEEELPEDREEGKKEKKKKKKKKQNSQKSIVVALICIILAILIAAGTAVAYFYSIGKEGEYNDDGIDYNNEADIIEDENLDFEAMGSVTDAASLNEYLYNWANNKGEKMHSKNVINVLLCGVDTTGGTGRSDSMILVSVNKKAKTVTLSSFFRDSYIYMDIPLEGGGYKGRYEKINASFSLGGPATLIDTIEKNFKIEIDEYIMVDFTSFRGIIDAVGGITVDVEKNESDFIRRTSKQTKFPSGKNCHLNGTQALIYSRIRKLDSDVNRTERQRKVIKSLITSAQGATKGQLVNAYKKCAKYLTTSYSQSEILGLIGTAVAQDWMHFKINEITLPAEEGTEMMSTYTYTTSSPGALQWVWIVDYPLCAQKLQLAIYGESNIVLKEGRDTALKFMQSNNITGDSSTDTGNGNSAASAGSGSRTTAYSYYYTQPTYNYDPYPGGSEDVGGGTGTGSSEDIGGGTGTGGGDSTGGGTGEIPVTPAEGE